VADQRRLTLFASMVYLLVAIAVVGHKAALAQQNAEPPPAAEVGSNQPPAALPEPAPGGPLRHLGLDEITLAALVLAFGVVTLVFEFMLMRGKSFAPDEILKVLSVTLIIDGALFIITAGFDSEQIAPAMGLFGTIAGYLLAKRGTGDRSGRPQDE
jgi:hypothetical protein